MLRFNLKTLFCLTLVVGVTLMWGSWARGTDETANKLLAIRKRMQSLPDIESIGEVTNWVGVELDWTKIDYAYTPGGDRPRKLKATYSTDLWLGCHLTVMLVPPVSAEWRAVWPATDPDWPAIEKKAREENRTFYGNIIVTCLASLMIGCVLLIRASPDAKQ
ncbi:MAG: hypothetical protein ACI9HK_003210 [Pirellulaceae bacterium]|jgi:hypothetical protein